MTSPDAYKPLHIKNLETCGDYAQRAWRRRREIFKISPSISIRSFSKRSPNSLMRKYSKISSECFPRIHLISRVCMFTKCSASVWKNVHRSFACHFEIVKFIGHWVADIRVRGVLMISFYIAFVQHRLLLILFWCKESGSFCLFFFLRFFGCFLCLINQVFMFWF